MVYAEQLIVFGPYLRDLPVYERASFSWTLLYEPEVLRREYDYIYYSKKLVEPVYRYTIYLYGLFAYLLILYSILNSLPMLSTLDFIYPVS